MHSTCYFWFISVENDLIDSLVRRVRRDGRRIFVVGPHVLFEGMLSWCQPVAIITTINQLHVLCVNMLVHNFFPVMTVATLATRPISWESIHFNLFPDLLIRSLLLFCSFHNHWNEQKRSHFILTKIVKTRQQALELLMLRSLMLLQSMLGWREFKTNIAAVLNRHMLRIDMLLHDIVPEVVVRALFAAPLPCVGIHLQLASNQAVRRFFVLHRACNCCCWNSTN